MGDSDEPLWAILRDAMAEKELSIRGLARELHRLEPATKFNSWHRSVRRYLDPDRPTLPTPDTALLLAQALGKPPAYFVRRIDRRERLKQRVEEQQEEIQRLRDELDGKRASS